MAKTPQTAAADTSTAAPEFAGAATADTAAPETAAPAPAIPQTTTTGAQAARQAEPVVGERLATALCRIRREGRTYDPGDPVPVDRDAFRELRAFEAVEAGAFDALPAAA